MIYNISKNDMNCCAVNVPWMGDEEQEIIKDIAALTGATVIDNTIEYKI